MNSSISLSIVTSLYRSSPYVDEFHRRATAAAQALTADYEIIFVNDGSPDDSLERAVAIQRKDPRVVVIDLSRNFGHHRALMTGLAYARGERIFVLDADLEEEPEWLKLFDEEWRQQTCDVVFGIQERRKGGLFERWSGEIFYRIFNFLSATPIPANAVIARLMSRRYVNALIQHQERELFLPGLWQVTGFRQIPVPVAKLSKGSTSYSLARKFALFVDAITSFSDKPLIIIFYVGAFICASSIIYILRLLYLKWVIDVPIMGWPSLIVSIWLLGGATIFFIGVLGIYLARMFREIKQRPSTIIREVYSASPERPLKNG
jgi:putative glycosyltransferase